jgi:hypothetical protein
MDGALKDEAYQTTEAIIESKSGISWFARWQLAQGKRLIAEPKVCQSVEEVWDNRNDKNVPPPPKPPAPPEPSAPAAPPAPPVPPAPPELTELP